MKFFCDMFKGMGGEHWDLARAAAAWAILSYSFAFLYALVWKGVVPDWTNLGIGYATVMGGAVAFVAGKDLARAKAAGTDAATAQTLQNTEASK